MIVKTSSPIQIITAFIGLFLLFSTVALINTATADESGTRANSISHIPSDTSISASAADSATSDYISPEFTAEFPFNGVGLTWTGPQNAAVTFAIAVDAGSWQTLTKQGEDAKDEVEYFTTAPLFISGQRLRYRITGSAVNEIRNVRLTYFDSTTAPQRSLFSTVSQRFKRAVQSDTPTIISRAEWGADDSYLTWKPDYSTPKKIIIHHTAGGNGTADPAATIRGIYYWHAVVLGWGDIGYNYLVDQQGNIYEGRAGGAGVIGAHTYDDSTDTNYNVGSVGISLLGCFETTTGACTNVSEYTETIDAALTDIISAVASSTGFDPAGSKKWHGEKMPNVIGHRTVDSTYCPGEIVYDQLDVIRSAANSKYALLQAANQPVQAQWQSSNVAASYYNTETPSLTFTYINVGSTAWQPNTTALQLSITETRQRQRIDFTDTVPTNATLTLTTNATLLPKHSGTYTLVSKLYRKGQIVPGSTQRYPITVTAAYQATLEKADLPLAIQVGWTPTLFFAAQNTGTANWPAGTVLQVNDKALKTLKQAIIPGEMLNLELPYAAAAEFPPGTYLLKIQLTAADGTAVQGSRSIRSLRVDEN